MSGRSNEEQNDDLEEILAEAVFVESLLDAEKRLVQAARLTERVLKTYFVRGEEARKGLRSLLNARKPYLSRADFSNASFAVTMRNRISHHTERGLPTDEQMVKAAEVLLAHVRRHVEEARQGLGGTSDQEASPPEPNAQEHKSAPSARDGKPSPEPVVDRIHSEPLAELVAGENDPWLTASTLAEYAYCPRAGLLTHEGSYSDPEVELPALGLMYWYESERVEEAYAEACYRLFWMVFGLVIGVAVVAVSPLIEIPLTMLLLVGVLGYWVYQFCIDFRNWAAVGRERIECRHAPACEPDAMSTKPQAVNWWGLLRADFSVERPVDSLRDNAWRLSGKPRRFLQKGDLVIPVHRINSSDGNIKPQQIVRVMAHCHLVSSDRGAVSPYAIILFGRSHEGVTVPNTLANREQLYDVLRRARVAIAEVASGERLLPRPAPASPCKTCPHSRPRLMSDLQPTMKDGEALDPYLLVDRKGERWHSDCGDRFGEKALHKRAERLVEIGYPPTD